MNPDVLRKNLEALKDRYPEWAERIIDLKPEDSPYAIIRSPSGVPNLRISTGSELLYFYEPDDPIRSAQKYLEGMTVKYACFVVFLGLGLGHHLNLFFKDFSEKWGTREIIIYEEDPRLFRLALSIGDYREIIRHPHIHFFVGERPQESFTKIRKHIFTADTYALRSIKLLPLPTSTKLHRDYYLEAVATVKKAANQIMIAAGNDSFDSFVGVENMFSNLPHILSNPGINTLFDQFKGKPGVLVAAGPSLNKNMHLLKTIRDKALIISCDASFVPLMKKGIRPHMVTSMERTPGTEMFYSDIDDFSGIYFVAVAVLMKEVMETFKGKKFIAYRTYSHFDWLELEKGSLYSGLSVANMAFKILASLGCDPIILIGQDLAYASDGDTHVQGNVFGSRDEALSAKPVIELEGNYGTPVKSEKIWEVIKLAYESDLESFQGTCINATEGGARIRGTQVMSFREAIDRYCREDIFPGDTLEAIHSRYMADLSPRPEWERLRRKTDETIEKVSTLIERFRQAAQTGREVEQDVIQPFIEGKKIEAVDMKRLLAVEETWVEIFQSICNDRDLYNILYQTIQPYDTWLSNELSFMKDIYSNREILSMARVRGMKQWFEVVGSFLIFTRLALVKAQKLIDAERGRSEPPSTATSVVAVQPAGPEAGYAIDGRI